MKSRVAGLGRSGFTLIEVLVTLILLALLAAAVFPVVTQQSDQGDPVRVANDLGSVRSGIEQFRLDVRPSWPGDLEDLVHEPTNSSTTDPDLNRNAISNSTKWNGPYIDAGIAIEDAAIDADGTISTAFGGTIDATLTCLSSGATVKTNYPATADCAPGDVVALKITGIDTTEGAKIERAVDNGDGTTVDTNGKFRHPGSGTDAFYVIGPFF